MDHPLHMQHCLDIAARYLASVAPNPMVGACLVVDNQVIASAAHQTYGEAHAEVLAIAQLTDKEQLKKALLYVSLEPCNHQGKTPPCTELIIKSGIRTVVVATRDPNPLVSGSGIARLIENGITVIENILNDKAQFLNRRFFTFHQKKRPYVILKWAETADGFIARQDGTSKWISGSESRKLVHQWRAQEQAILVGTRTALADNPALTVRDAVGKNPLRIVIDRANILPTDLHLWGQEAQTLCFSDSARQPHGNEKLITLSNEDVITQILADLYKRNIISLIVEGGADTINRFLTADLWDEARIFKSKCEFGQGVKAPNFEHFSITGMLKQNLTIADDLLSIISKVP
jgi:diaminohydroxyphosphoribosylaminopyrimidine deaminase / 5-amino-6-(5-phosphoribosylamino)uracil reductase